MPCDGQVVAFVREAELGHCLALLSCCQSDGQLLSPNVVDQRVA